MPQRHVILPGDLDAAVRAYAAAYGISISDAIRILLTRGLRDPQGT